MSNIVAVAGGSGGLGRSIIDALKADGRYKPLILGRKADPKLEKEIGVPILVVDYSNVEGIAQVLEQNVIDTVITTINPPDMSPTSEVNLVKAANTSKVTRRFIPNYWSGFDYTPEQAALFPPAASKFIVLDALEKTELEWTLVLPGLFLDYFVPTLPSYVKKMFMVVDTRANMAAIPGSGDYALHFTHTKDIGKFVAALVSVEKWEKKYFISADSMTWHQMVALAEKVKGVKFDVVYDSPEKLKRGEVTEHPSHKIVYEMFGGEAVGKPMLQGMVARFSLFWVDRQGEYKDGPFLNELFPEIKPLSVEEAFKDAYSSV